MCPSVCGPFFFLFRKKHDSVAWDRDCKMTLCFNAGKKVVARVSDSEGLVSESWNALALGRALETGNRKCCLPHLGCASRGGSSFGQQETRIEGQLENTLKVFFFFLDGYLLLYTTVL